MKIYHSDKILAWGLSVKNCLNEKGSFFLGGGGLNGILFLQGHIVKLS